MNLGVYDLYRQAAGKICTGSILPIDADTSATGLNFDTEPMGTRATPVRYTKDPESGTAGLYKLSIGDWTE
jgi:hypothetical protein